MVLQDLVYSLAPPQSTPRDRVDLFISCRRSFRWARWTTRCPWREFPRGTKSRRRRKNRRNCRRGVTRSAGPRRSITKRPCTHSRRCWTFPSWRPRPSWYWRAAGFLRWWVSLCRSCILVVNYLNLEQNVQILGHNTIKNREINAKKRNLILILA